MTTYDCFMFFNELDLLNIRLNILNNVVDKFVLVESKYTFSGINKPLFYEENKELFKDFNDKIIHLTIEKFPENLGVWEQEYYQRRYCANGFRDANDDDIIMISDLDEIPNPIIVEANKNTPGLKSFQHYMFYYYLNCANSTNPYWNKGTKMLSIKDFKQMGADLQNLRFNYSNIIPKAGWHWSYLGTPEIISYKIKSFAHQELNHNKFTNPENIIQRIQNKEDLFCRGDKFEILDINKNPEIFPEYLINNLYKYKHLMTEI